MKTLQLCMVLILDIYHHTFCEKSTIFVDLFDKIKLCCKAKCQINKFPCGKIKCHKLSTLVIGRTLTKMTIEIVVTLIDTYYLMMVCYCNYLDIKCLFQIGPCKFL